MSDAMKLEYLPKVDKFERVRIAFKPHSEHERYLSIGNAIVELGTWTELYRDNFGWYLKYSLRPDLRFEDTPINEDLA